MKLTLKEMTRRLGSVSTETTETLNRQLRSWTDAGILSLVGDVNTGSGRERIYPDQEVFFAAVAVELAQWGMTIGVIKHILSRLRSGVSYLSDDFDFRTDIVASDTLLALQLRALPEDESHDLPIRPFSYLVKRSAILEYMPPKPEKMPERPDVISYQKYTSVIVIDLPRLCLLLR
jgi:hypothetical protein